MQRTQLERLLLIRRAHDLKAEGYSQRKISEELSCARETVTKALRAPRPTDIELAMVPPEAEASTVAPRAQNGDVVRQRINMTASLQRRLLEEAELQGRPGSDVVPLAIAFYLDYTDRARNGSSEPINLLAYRKAA